MSRTDPHLVRDTLLEGCSIEQRGKGKLPTPDKNAKYLEGILARLDKQEQERKPAPVKADKVIAEDKVDKFNREAKKLAARKGFDFEGSFQVEKGSVMTESPLVITKDDPLKKLLRHRIRLLQSKPDWRAKLERINPLALQGYLGPDKKEHAVFLVREIIRASNEIFGDWWKPTPRKLWSFTGQPKR